MKDWFKKVEIDQYDVLVQRISNEEDGEHVKVTVRMNGFELCANYGYEDDSEKADKLFNDKSDTIAKEVLEYFQKHFNP